MQYSAFTVYPTIIKCGARDTMFKLINVAFTTAMFLQDDEKYYFLCSFSFSVTSMMSSYLT